MSGPVLRQHGLPEETERIEPASNELLGDFLMTLDSIAHNRFNRGIPSYRDSSPYYSPMMLDRFDDDCTVHYTPWLPERPGRIMIETPDYRMVYQFSLRFPHNPDLEIPRGDDPFEYEEDPGAIATRAPIGHQDRPLQIDMELTEVQARNDDPDLIRHLRGAPKDILLDILRQIKDFPGHFIGHVIPDHLNREAPRAVAGRAIRHEENREEKARVDEAEKAMLDGLQSRERRDLIARLVGLSPSKLDKCVDCGQRGGPPSREPRVAWPKPLQSQSNQKPLTRRNLLGKAATGGVAAATVLTYELFARKLGWISPLKNMHDALYPDDGERNPDRRVSELEIPEDISDTGLILYTAWPVYDHRTGQSYDTVMDSDPLSRYFFQDRLQIAGVEEEMETWTGDDERVYRLTVPSEDTGEVLNGSRGRLMQDGTTWAHVLNMITKVRQMTDRQVIKFLVWWFKKTYQIDLDPSSFKIKRNDDKSIDDIYYTGSNTDEKIRFQKIRILDRIPENSARGRRDTVPERRRFTSDNNTHRLLLWTGVGQDILIPESMLIDASEREVTLPLRMNDAKGREKKAGSVDFTWQEFAQSVRRYFENRDKGESFIRTKPGTNEKVTTSALEHYVAANDPIVKRIVAKLCKGCQTNFAKADCIRRFIQGQTEYDWEAGEEINRPAVATLMHQWGDCNNLTVAAATLFKAAGLRVGIAYAYDDPAKQDPNSADFGTASHVLVAIHKDSLKGSGVDWYPNTYTIGKTEKWVLFEPQHIADFGDFNLGKKMTATHIREV
ncbi:transglutaminase domain-containing protein [Candidatus Peregrinibacteria bacterium]|nr:transglutaminase domain-containing protein [Candidatus Peregrinibacteria bacterium]MBT7483967.1 transglutaminase domain-containing protein [Candidatus Peregrinibacteria bacterium]MBT7703321.1 transglutaminase domain-containing protein [Candidatus Peregrinibacteria bacterium]